MYDDTKKTIDKIKTLRGSFESKGGCKLLSKGTREDCDCPLCVIDQAIDYLIDLDAGCEQLEKQQQPKPVLPRDVRIRALADSPAFPYVVSTDPELSMTMEPGMSYKQWLVGQLAAGMDMLRLPDSGESTNAEDILRMADKLIAAQVEEET